MYAESNDGGNEFPSFALDSILKDELMLIFEDSFYRISPNKKNLNLEDRDWDIYVIRGSESKYFDNYGFNSVKNLIYGSSEIFRKVW